MSRPIANGAPNGYRHASNSSTNPSLAHSASNSQMPGGPMASPNRGQSRAERFEDEKKRIMESCFSKLDAGGQLAESYITHIRIQEDGAHPSSPPPPDSPPESKKPRLVIIAVRSTGRVRMHKARENNNGSFSIGKTWNLEELSAIETFSSNPNPPQSEREAQHRAWAGAVGFTVTITKPYYWQAGTAKEKEFFIASTVKIYRKYTKGQVPELKGFDEAQKIQMLGAMPGQQQPQQPPQGPPHMGTQPSREDVEPIAPPQPPFAQRPQSREDSRYRGSPGPPPSMSDRGGSGPDSRRESPAPYGQPLASPPSIPKPFASTEHLRSNSREPYRDPQRELRPGTAPGPGGYQRSPPPNVSQMPRAPSAQSRRPKSPAGQSVSSRGDVPRSLQAGPTSPRKTSFQSVESVTSDHPTRVRSPPPSTSLNGNTTGAGLFQSTQQRWQNQNQQQEHTQASPQLPPQLPPLETTRSNTSYQSHRQQSGSTDRVPRTTESEISSPGLGDVDAAAFAAIGGFMGPEHSFAAAPPPSQPVVNVQEPSSPPTPERSQKRPPVESPRRDEDLKPAPLTQRNVSGPSQRSFAPPLEGGSTYATPMESPALTPQREEPPPPQARDLSPPPAPKAPEPSVTVPVQPQPPAVPSHVSTPAAEPPPAAEEPKQEDVEPEDVYRPGLGPMIKKQAVAERFKKAANAANAFKPRPGGAAEKILKAKAEREAGTPGAGEPDGITGVVPRPLPAPAVKEPDQLERPSLDLAIKAPDALVLEDKARDLPGLPPKVEVSSPLSPARETGFGGMDGQGVQLADQPHRLSTPDQQSHLEEEDQENIEQREIRQPQIKVKRRSAIQEQYLAELGIDRSLLADRGLEFETMLTDFGWNDAALSPKALADMETNLKREQARLEAGAWLSSPSQETQLREEREKQVSSLLDKAIQECDEMDGLLTIYGVELSTLNEDISYIEAQSQGLQVQAANQRTLHTELSQLVGTLSLGREVFEPLRHADLASENGVDEAEQGLVKVYEALVKIDPSIRQNSSGARPKSRGDMNEGGEVAGMKAVRQKREEYGRESDRFCQRVMQHLDSSFSASFTGVKSKVLLPVQTNPGMMKLNQDAFIEARRGLWMYSPLVLFTKELNKPAWQTMMRMYYGSAKPLYADAFGQNVAYWKRCLRKPTGEEVELLFTTLEKEDATASSGGALSSARKLTVKRSQTLAKTLRTASGEKNRTAPDSRDTGSRSHSEVFDGAIGEMAPLLASEQNFVVDFFHATSLETADFMDVVARTPVAQRYGTNLAQQKPLDPDRETARLVTSVMAEVFSFFTNELTSLVDWCVTADPIQGVGVMACLTKHSFYLQDTSQEFLIQLLDTLKSRLMTLFAKFVDEQVRAIEDTKVKIKKRKGVIGFMKTFPHFAMAVENTFAAVGREDYERNAPCVYDTCVKLDEAYDRINRAMFDSLKVIAKESPGGRATTTHAKGGGDDAEDKEMLNYHVLVIENMNHYIAEVDDGGRQSVLAEWKGRAEVERGEAMEAYVGQVLRRPLGKLLEFLDSLDSMKASHPSNPASVISRPTYSRKAARNVLSQYDSKEIRRGIDQLRARIEKHFGHGDDEVKSRELVTLVCKECERAYSRTIDRIEEMVRDLYPVTEGEKGVEAGFSRTDVQSGFSR